MGENDHEKIKEYATFWRLKKNSKISAREIVEWKKNHQGILPKSVWLNTLEVAGSYSCVEVLPYNPENGTIYLKERNDPSAMKGEKEWEGKLHIPGISESPSAGAAEVLSGLLKKEILRDPKNTTSVVNNLRFLTQARYPEPERKTIANTLVLLLPINPELLQEDFFPVAKGDLQQVIAQHRPLLEKYWEGNMLPILDTGGKMTKKLVKLIKVPAIVTDGMLCQLQSPEIPFEIKRVYYIKGVSEGAIRGAHTHKETIQAIFCIQGSIKIILDDGRRKENVFLDEPNLGVLLEPGIWHEMQDFRKDTILLVLASKEHESGDYVRSYEDFLRSYAKD